MRDLTKYPYGKSPLDITATDFGLGWLAGVRHLKTTSARESFWHRHREIQLLYCVKGEVVYEFERLPRTVLTTGHYIVIPAGLPHRHHLAIDPASHRVELMIAPESARTIRGTAPADVVSRARKRLLAQRCRPVAADRELGGLFTELDALADRGRERLTADEMALARTLGTLILLRCNARRRQLARKDEGRMMDEAVAWLERHAGERVHIDRLVAYMGYSRTRLFDLFREHTGLPPADYLARLRIRRARELLARPGSPIGEVARECGFATLQHFSTAFRRQTGLTPTEWRNRCGQSE